MSLHDQFNSPLLREWELNENSTHYDKQIAAPSNDDMVKMWTAWSVVTYLFAVYTTSVLLALVCTRKIRQSSFNLFLIYLMIPDTLVLWLCGTSCLINALAGRFTSMGHCQFQSFYLVSTLSANAWLNVAITRHLLVMLRSANQFIKYQPPSRKQVTIEAICVYLYAMFLASWFVIDAEWWPFKTRLNSGVVCLPQDFSYLSTAFYYAVFFPLCFLIPLGYVCYAVIVIWRQRLLPTSGGKRALAIYFFRLVLAFLVMWGPCLLLLIVTSPWTDPWVQWAGALWGHMQGAVSGVISLFKPDIWKAYVSFYRMLWSCLCPREEDLDDQDDDCESNSSSILTSRASSGFFSNMFASSRQLGRRSTKQGLVRDLQKLKEHMAGEASSPERRMITAESSLGDLESIDEQEPSTSSTRLERTATLLEEGDDTSTNQQDDVESRHPELTLQEGWTRPQLESLDAKGDERIATTNHTEEEKLEITA